MLAPVAGCAALTLGLAAGAVAGSGAVQAQTRPQAIVPPLTQTGAVSWGSNQEGQLGTGTTTSSALFQQVSGLGSGVVQVSAGSSHSLALTSDGSVWAWGANSAGELGNGTLTNSSVPVKVTGLTGVIKVAAGSGHSLALRSDGTVWAWGVNTSGQLGDGTITGSGDTPVQVSGLTGITQIAAGGLFSLALRSDGTVWAWGDNSLGQLGDNSTTLRSDVPVRVAGLSMATSIAAGSVTGLATRFTPNTSAQILVAWGGNEAGQLGDGMFTSRRVVAQVTGIGAPSIAGIAAGDLYCLVLGSDGSVWGWGANDFGQLGSAPSSILQTRPVQTIAPGSGITQLSAGSGFTLALRSDRTVLAFGKDDFGQLGNGVMTTGTVGIVQVTRLTGATEVSAGGFHSLAVRIEPQIVI
jgi:alpha-tubulin suppressor-like RCC1 family protein